MRATQTHTATLAGAVAGLIIWIISQYVFHGNMPAPLQASLLIILPAVEGGLVAFWTRRDAKEVAPVNGH